MACPWQEWGQAPAAFCEASLCAWIRQPGNTWSNVGFLVAAVPIFAATRADHRHLRSMAWILLLMAGGSTVYHATETRFGLWLDYAGMVSMTAYMAGFVVGRSARLGLAGRRAVFGVLLAIGMTPLTVDGLPLRGTFAALNLICPTFELLLAARKATRAANYRWLAAAWFTFSVAFALWVLDGRGVLCDPDDHVLSGHAAWHLLDALMFWCSFAYYRQFPAPRQ